MINTKIRKFHDFWGNKRGNRCAQVGRLQYLVSHYQLDEREIDCYLGSIDWDKIISHSYDKYVRGSRVEGLRR